MATPIPLKARLQSGVPATVLALHCGELGIQSAFGELLDVVAPGESIERIAIPGGPWWLSQAAALTDGRIKRVVLGGKQPVRQVVDSLLATTTLRKALLLGHQDCSWYRRRFPRLSPGDLIREQGADIYRSRDEVERWAGRSLEVSGWMLVADAAGEVTGRRLF